MKKYDVSLRTVSYCRLSVYANSIKEAKEAAISRVKNNGVSYYDKEILLTDINEIECTKKDIIKHRMFNNLFEDQYNEDDAREFFEEAFRLGLINRMPK